MGVSGSPSAPIQIKSSAVDNDLNATAIIGGAGWVITGSYLHLARLFAKHATVGFNINGAQHVSLDQCHCALITNQGFWVHNNAQYIFMRNCVAGYSFTYIDGTAETMTSGVRVGTPSASWVSGVPDATNQVTIHSSEFSAVQGHSVELLEGAHHVRLIDVKTSGDGAIAANPASPPVWNGIDSSASDVTAQRAFNEIPVYYGVRLQSKVVGGTTYGVRQQLWRHAVGSPGGRTSGGVAYGGYFASNDPTHKLWFGGVDAVASQINPPLVDLAPTVTTWANARLNQPLTGTEDYKWGSPAEEYQYTYPEAANEAGLMKYKYGIDPAFLVSELGTQFIPLTKWASYGQAFYHNETDQLVQVTKIGYFQAYMGQAASFGAIFDMATGQMVPNSMTTLKAPTPAYYGWQHTTLTQSPPILLYPNRMYKLAIWCAPGAYPISWSDGERTGGFAYTDGNTNKFICYPQNSGSGSQTGFLDSYGNVWPATASGGLTSSVDNNPPPNPPWPWDPTLFISPTAPQSGANFMIDIILGYYRLPSVQVVSPVLPPPEGSLQGKVKSLIAGDTLTISGLQTLDHTLVIDVNGTPNRPIIIQGDGTTIFRGAFGVDTAYVGLIIRGSYIKLQNFSVDNFGRGVVCDGAQNIKIKNVTTHDIRGNGFTCENACQYIYYDTCVAHDCGSDLNTGNGFRCGTTPSQWGVEDSDISTDQLKATLPVYGKLISGDAVFPPPVNPDHIRYDNCSTYRTLGDGFVVCSGTKLVVLKGCTADHSQGNAPVINSGAGSACFHSRADKVQFINCTAIAAPQAGFECYDVLWESVTYGRGQQVKAGSATLPGQGGVVSQSDDMKVYSDFTSTGTHPRVVEIEGGWSASGSNVAPASFVETTWPAPAAIY